MCFWSANHAVLAASPGSRPQLTLLSRKKVPPLNYPGNVYVPDTIYPYNDVLYTPELDHDIRYQKDVLFSSTAASQVT